MQLQTITRAYKLLCFIYTVMYLTNSQLHIACLDRFQLILSNYNVYKFKCIAGI